MRHLLLLPLILAACAARPPAPPIGDQTEPTLGTCNAAKAQFAVGQMVDAALIEKVRAAAGVKIVRQLRPGQIVAMNYTNMRINLDLDGNGKVVKVRCG